MPPTEAVHSRAPGTRLARTHLRAGLLSLARVELEAIAGTDELDDEALLDLAEVRWRTGDLSGAGEAAEAHLAAGGEAALAFAIAAEAMAAVGRPGEARRLAGKALEHATGPVDRLFAGMPRSGAWPVDPADPGEQVGSLFPEQGREGRGGPSPHRPTTAVVAGTGHRGAGGQVAGGQVAGDQVAGGVREASGSAGGGHPPSGTHTFANDGTQAAGLWDGDGAPHFAEPAPPDAIAELDAGRAACADGRVVEGAIHLSVALRLSPALAPAVLGAIGGARHASLELVRGDAYRMVGHEIEARRSYAAAAHLVGAPSSLHPTLPDEPGGGESGAGSDSDPGADVDRKWILGSGREPDARRNLGSDRDPDGRRGSAPDQDSDAQSGFDPGVRPLLESGFNVPDGPASGTGDPSA